MLDVVVPTLALRYDSALYLPYCGEHCGRGKRKKYGDKPDYENIPVQYRKKL